MSFPCLCNVLHVLFSLVVLVMWFSVLFCHWFIVHCYQVCLVKSLVFVYVYAMVHVKSLFSLCRKSFVKQI